MRPSSTGGTSVVATSWFTLAHNQEEHHKFSPCSRCRSLRTWTLQAMEVGPGLDAMIGEHWQLVTNELVDFEK